MGTGSPGSAWVLHLLNAELNPRPDTGPTSGTYHICSHRGKVPGLMAGGSSGVCSLSDWDQSSRLNQGKARLGQGTTMD